MIDIHASASSPSRDSAARAPKSDEVKPLTSLRGLAALWVLLHHITTIDGTRAAFAPDSPFMRFTEKGWFGVDIFFILSGYILMQRYFDANVSRRVFYLRRFARIYPLYITSIALLAVMVAAAGPLHVQLNHPELYSLTSLVFSVVMLQAILFPQPPWNFVSWSLSFEMLCYAILPFAMAALRRMSAAQKTWLFLILLSVYVITGALTQNPTSQLPGLARSVSAFFCGGLACLIFGRTAMPPFLAEVALALLAVVAVAADSPVYLIPLAVIAVPAVARSRRLAARLMSGPVLVRLGTISYSVYLLQTLVYYPLNKLFPLGLIHDQTVAKAVMIGVFVALVVAAAEVSYRVVEAPSRRWLTERFAQRPAQARA